MAIAALTVALVSCRRHEDRHGAPGRDSPRHPLRPPHPLRHRSRPGTVNVKLGEMFVRPNVTQGAAGKITFHVQNTGKLVHEMIVGKPPIKGPLATGKMSEATSVGEVAELKPGTAGSVKLSLKPGNYILYCNVAGPFRGRAARRLHGDEELGAGARSRFIRSSARRTWCCMAVAPRTSVLCAPTTARGSSAFSARSRTRPSRSDSSAGASTSTRWRNCAPRSTTATATASLPSTGDDGRIVAHAMYAGGGHDSVEVAFAIAEELAGQGLGTLLLAHLAEAAAACGYTQFHAEVLAENSRMLEVFRDSGFPVTFSAGRWRGVRAQPGFAVA